MRARSISEGDDVPAGTSRMTRGAALAILAALLFGSLGVFAKLAYGAGWNVPSLLSFRFLIGALVLAPFAWHAHVSKAQRAQAPWRSFGAAFLIGALGYTGITALYFPSIRLLPAAVAAFLLYLAPGIVAILAAIFLRERLGARGIAALLLALAGLALLASGALTGALSTLGVALAAGSAVVYAGVTVAARNVAQRMPWSHLSLGVALGAGASYLTFSAATGQLHLPPGREALAWAIGIGVISTGISMSLFFAALRYAPASQVSVISTLEPVSTLALAALVLGEVPAWTSVAGGLLIVGGAALIAWQEPMTAPHE